jgi:hypothetical protein
MLDERDGRDTEWSKENNSRTLRECIHCSEGKSKSKNGNETNSS